MTMALDEKIVKPDILGVVADANVRAELTEFKPPTQRTKATERVIWCTAKWALNQQRARRVYEDEVVKHLIDHHHKSPEQADALRVLVFEALAKRGVRFWDRSGREAERNG